MGAGPVSASPCLRRLVPFSSFFIALFLIAGSGGTVAAENDSCPVLGDDDTTVTTVKSDLRTPAARTTFTVVFETSKALDAHSDSIVMELHEDIGVPAFISPADVRVSCNGITIPAPIVAPENASDPRRKTTINVFPTKDIPAHAEVKVIFAKEAGITNPTEGGAFSWTVATSQSTTPVEAQHPDLNVRAAFCGVLGGASDDVECTDNNNTGSKYNINGLLVDWEIQLTHERVQRGQEVTVIGRGYKNGTTLTFWRDANFDGIRDEDEQELCQVAVEGNDIGYCSFTVYRPPFVGASGKCETVANSGRSRRAADGADCNFINGVDGQNHTSIWVRKDKTESDKETAYKLEDHSQLLQLEGIINAEIGGSRRLWVQMQDFPEGKLKVLELGGVCLELDGVCLSEKSPDDEPIPTDELPLIPQSGALNFTVDLPGGVRRGYQSLRVVVTPDDYEVNTIIWVNPDAVVTAVPDQVLPNQRVHLKGRGFLTKDGAGEIEYINIGGHELDTSRVNDGDGPAPIDRHGSWRGTVSLPVNAATTVPGTKELRVVDVQGRGGTVEVTIPPRELAAVPVWGRPGSLVTVTGKGFPVRNDTVSNVNLRVYYDWGSGSVVASAEADAAGEFTVQIEIPLKTPAPSSNTIRVEFDDDQGSAVVTTTAHEVPGAAITLDPGFGPPGSPIALEGQGFRKFALVNSVLMGSTDVLPGGSVTTDANGDFSLTFLAPGVGVGRQTVQVTVAGVTAAATFDLSKSGVAAGNAVPVAEALADLGDALEVIFHFNNDRKEWTYYDPELAVEQNTQAFMIPGETYLILVSETVQAILNGKTRNLTCHQGFCWNQIIW